MNRHAHLILLMIAGMVLFQSTNALFAQVTPAGAMPDTARTTLSASGVTTNRNLMASVALSPDHTTLGQLLKASGLYNQAVSGRQYTVFAPTNAAFSVLEESTLRELLLPSSKKRLQQLLAYHIVAGRLTSDKLKDGQNLTNLTGQILVVHKQGDYITVEDGRGVVANVIQANIRATNGVVYSIDKVLERITK